MQELETPNPSNSFSFAEFFKPSSLKIIFSILFLVLLIFSIVANLIYLPQIGESICNGIKVGNEITQLNQNLKTKIFENNAKPDKIIELKKESEEKSFDTTLNFRNKLSNPILINSDLYLYLSRLYNLNPFFPMPCEIFLSLQEAPLLQCAYYMTEKDYNCIDNRTKEIEKKSKTEETLSSGVYFFLNAPNYKQASFFSIIINSIFLCLIFYLFMCIISFVYNKIIDSENLRKLAIIILFIMMVLFGYINLLYIIFWVPVAIGFIILFFIKDDNKRKNISYILAGIFIILLIVSAVVVFYFMNQNIITDKGTLTQYMLKYEIVYCNNTQMLTIQDKENFKGSNYIIPKDLINEEWNVCYNPDCKELCKNKCDSSNFYTLRGNKPSCICNCYN